MVGGRTSDVKVDRVTTSQRPQPSPGGPDGHDVEGDIAGHLDYLTRLCDQLGVSDPVEEYFGPVVGRWSDLHAEAERWRSVGETAEKVTESLTKPLGGLDAAWDGADADSYIDYMQRVGLAGNDMSDAMIGMAEVLDKTADGIREIVMQMADVLADAAESSSEAMAAPVQGEERARLYLDDLRRPTRELFEAVRQVLEAFVQLCDGVDGGQAFREVTMAHRFPEDNWTLQVDLPKLPADQPGEPAEKPSEPQELKAGGSGAGGGGAGGGGATGGGGGGGGGGGAGSVGGAGPRGPIEPGGYTLTGDQPAAGGNVAGAAAASAGAAKGGPAGGGMPFMPMGGMMGAGQGGDSEHKSRSRVVGDPADIFGKPTKTSPPVIGEDD